MQSLLRPAPKVSTDSQDQLRPSAVSPRSPPHFGPKRKETKVQKGRATRAIWNFRGPALRAQPGNVEPRYKTSFCGRHRRRLSSRERLGLPGEDRRPIVTYSPYVPLSSPSCASNDLRVSSIGSSQREKDFSPSRPSRHVSPIRTFQFRYRSCRDAKTHKPPHKKITYDDARVPTDMVVLQVSPSPLSSLKFIGYC